MRANDNQSTRYIVVTGGVMSGLGKGVVSASTGKLLQSLGYTVTAIKIDPYYNIDPGTMRPDEHGEVFVLKDGYEVDQDFGTYERIAEIELSGYNNITNGQIHKAVTDGERAGDYLGKTVQKYPHLSNEVQRRIKEVAEKDKTDFVLIEIGGTAGDEENKLFYRSVETMQSKGEDMLFMHVSYFPIPPHLGEQKSKPTQQSLDHLREVGIKPDFLIGRSPQPIDDKRKAKLEDGYGIKKEYILSSPDVDSIYKVPLILDDQKLGYKILEKFGLDPKQTNLDDWRELVDIIDTVEDPVRIGIVGKYFETGASILRDSYVSVIEALKHAAWYNYKKPEIDWISATKLEKDSDHLTGLKKYDGIVVPGGFGNTGVEGKIMAAKYSRENDVPYLGLCYGLQMSTIELARNVCGLDGAHTTECNPNTPHPVVTILDEQRNVTDKGGTMRLGNQEAIMKPGTKIWELYGKRDIVVERHRHRYEINPNYHDILQENGMVFSGASKDGKLVEFAELEGYLFFVGTQAHPEFTSRALKPNPMFNGFIKASTA